MGMSEGSIAFWEITTLVAAQTLVSLIFFSAAIAILVFLIRKPIRKYKKIDLAVFDAVKQQVTPRRNQIMLFITSLGNHRFLVPANLLLIGYFLFVKHQTWFSIRVLTIALSSLVLMLFLKALFQRKRPLAPLLKAVRGLSFPSGHAIMSTTFYGLLLYIILSEAGLAWVRIAMIVVLVMLILLIGYSRIYLRVHYASDVLAGFIIGLLWLLISLGVLNRLEDFTSEDNMVTPGIGSMMMLQRSNMLVQDKKKQAPFRKPVVLLNHFELTEVLGKKLRHVKH